MKHLFDNHDYNRHMPYIFEGNKILYCRAECEDTILEQQGIRPLMQLGTETKYRSYRACVADLDLVNGTVSNEIELPCCPLKKIYCSPNAYRDEDGLINFIYVREDVVSSRKPIYRAYKRKGLTFDALGEPEFLPSVLGLRSYCITENNRFKVVASSYITNAYVLVEDKQEKTVTKVLLGLCPFLRRISLVNGTNNLLMTYPETVRGVGNSEAVHFTDMMNLETLKVYSVKASDKSIYKSTIYGNSIVYSSKNESQGSYCMDLKIDEFSLGGGRIRPEVQNIVDFKKWQK